MSAPIARAALTGTGLDSPPSTYSRPLMVIGWNTPGTLLEARTAMPVLPVRNTTDSPVRRSVATTPKARFSFSSGRFWTALLTKFCNASPRMNPRSGSDQSDSSESSSCSATRCRSKPP